MTNSNEPTWMRVGDGTELSSKVYTKDGNTYYPMPDVIEVWMSDGSRWDVLDGTLRLMFQGKPGDIVPTIELPNRRFTLFRVAISKSAANERYGTLRDVIFMGWPLAVFRGVAPPADPNDRMMDS